MALTITNNNINNQYHIQQKYADQYKQYSSTKTENQPQNEPNTSINEIRDINGKSLKSYLSSDEKKVLKEVFGDLSVDNESNSLYNSSQSGYLLIGSKIDIKL